MGKHCNKANTDMTKKHKTVRQVCIDWNVVKTLIGHGIQNVPLPSLLFPWKHTDSVERFDAQVSL